VAIGGCSGIQLGMQSGQTFGAIGEAESDSRERQRGGPDAGCGRGDGSMANRSGSRLSGRPIEPARQECATTDRGGAIVGVELPPALRRARISWARVEPEGAWTRYRVAVCRDGKFRRISAQQSEVPVANGFPRDVGPVLARLLELGYSARDARRVVREARRNRVGQLRGNGNAIVPQLAAEFVACAMECLGIERQDVAGGGRW
jgi:hypothetical protein